MNIAHFHMQFVEYLDRKNTTEWSRESVEKTLGDFLLTCALPKDATVESIHKSIVSRMWGLGVLDTLLEDESISEIMVNGPRDVWYEKNGVIQKSVIYFESEDEVVALVNRLVANVGRKLDESTPVVDARLPDGSRLHAVIRPLSRTGAVVTIRRFPKTPFTLQRAVMGGALTVAMAEFLTACVKARHSILISGATGSGKTSMLNALAAKVPAGERIITIEDTAEIRLTHGHVVQLEARASNIEGKGEISIRTLVRNALRMRPDRILVGEVRGAEALDMLQAMNTGHRGSLTTVHANSPEEALERLTTMALMADVGLPDRAVRAQVASAIAYVIQVGRLPDGSRRVLEISEVTPQARLDGIGFKTESLFRYYPEKKLFLVSQILPARLDFFEAAGVAINPDWFIS